MSASGSSAGRVVHFYRPVGDRKIGPEMGRYGAEIVTHIQKHLGPVAAMMVETGAEYVQVNLLHVPPSEKRPFHVFVTAGMSDRAMHAPEEAGGYELAELYICLPADWPLEPEDLQDEVNSWPLLLLKRLARMPHMYHTWLFDFHTVPNDDPPVPFAENTELCGSMLVPPEGWSEPMGELKLNGKDTIYFLGVVPLHKDEMDYKIQHGPELLEAEFDLRGGIPDVVDPRRPSVVPKEKRPVS